MNRTKLIFRNIISAIFRFFWHTLLDSGLQKAEKSVMNLFLKLFNYIARHVSYTFSVAFITSLGGILIALYIALFLYATVHFESESDAWYFVRMFVFMTMIVYIPGYYLHFGMLNRLGIPCFTRSLNMINRYVKSGYLAEFTNPGEGIKLLQALEQMPGENIKAAAIYPALVMIPTVIQEYIMGDRYNALVLLAGISSAIFIYVFYTYITAELLTGNMRQLLKRRLVTQKISFDENFAFSIRKKFLFITFLVLIAMTELIIMFYFSSMKIKTLIPMLFVFFTIFTLAILLFFYLISIEQSLGEIECAATDLGKGGKGKLFLASLDEEIIKLGKGIKSAAYEVNEVRENLQRKVDERTAELNSALEKLKEKDKRIDIELGLASDIQKGILPVTPLRYNFITVVSYYHPMRKVSGDFFDLVPFDDGRLAVIIGDVSGHGMPAALVNSMLKISFNDAIRKSMSPAETFRYINEVLTRTKKTDEYLTAIIAIIGREHDVIFSNASHRKAVVFRCSTGKTEEWDTEGLPIGLIDNSYMTYGELTFKLEPGDRMLLFTDGLVEARNAEGDEFGESRLNAIMKETAAMPVEEAKNAIINSWEKYTGETEASDDVTFLLIEIDPSYNNFRIDLGKARDLLKEDKTAEAIKLLEKLNGINCNYESVSRLLGKAYMKNKNYHECIKNLEACMSNFKAVAEDYYILAMAHYNLKNYTESLDNSVKALRLKPEHHAALTIRALSLKKLNRFIEAAEIWKNILSLYPGDLKAIQELKK